MSERCKRSMLMGPQCELEEGHEGEHSARDGAFTWTDESQQKLLKGYRLD
jgi:hypothetical protein